MYPTKIKNNEVLIDTGDGFVPFTKWGPGHYSAWKSNTTELQNQTVRMFKKLEIVARNRYKLQV